MGSSAIAAGGERLNCRRSIPVRIKFNIIKKIGNARGCMLSPTIMGGDLSSCKAKIMTTIEKIVSNIGMVYILAFIGRWDTCFTQCGGEPRTGQPPHSRILLYSIRPISFIAGPNSSTIERICLPHSSAPIGDVSSRPEFAK